MIHDYEGIDAITDNRGPQPRVIVHRAPRHVGFSTELLTRANPQYLSCDMDGNLVLTDSTGAQFLYRPIGFDVDAKVIVCERVEPHRPDCQHPAEINVTTLNSGDLEYLCSGCGRIRTEPRPVQP